MSPFEGLREAGWRARARRYAASLVMDSSSARARALVAFAVLALGALALGGCGGGTGTAPRGSTAASVPAYVTAPFTHEQQLVQQGARLVVSDGCAACHLYGANGAAGGVGPNFTSFAGHHVTLADGRSALVNETFVRLGLADPRAYELRGYDAAPMLAALARTRLASQPAQITALAAFIEQVGPETE
jgi:hypothetical protein